MNRFTNLTKQFVQQGGSQRIVHSNFSIRHRSTAFSQRIKDSLQEIKDAGLYKNERIITTPQEASIRIESKPNENVLNFCANNYLGLSDNKELIESAHEGLNNYGLGLSSVRFICGTQDIHIKLENKIASFHNLEASILYASCFDANAGIFEALLNKEDAIISDKLNHASIIDGIRLCKAQRFLYEHMDLNDLENKCKEANKANAKNKIIVTDGCFSMDGDIAPLKDICDIADKYDCKVMIDECHATGFLGKTGRGTAEYWGVSDRIDIINSTLGKALGGATGGYTAASKEIVDMLRQRSRPYLFSNALAPSLVNASIKCFEMIEDDTSLRDKLEFNTNLFRTLMNKAGFELMGNKDHPIAPVLLKDAKLASQFAEDMLELGIYVIGFSFPVVPREQARIRVQISAGHSKQHIEQCVDAFVTVGKKHGIIQ